MRLLYCPVRDVPELGGRVGGSGARPLFMKRGDAELREPGERQGRSPGLRLPLSCSSERSLVAHQRAAQRSPVRGQCWGSAPPTPKAVLCWGGASCRGPLLLQLGLTHNATFGCSGGRLSAIRVLPRQQRHRLVGVVAPERSREGVFPPTGQQVEAGLDPSGTSLRPQH